MKASILTKLETLVERYEEVQHLLGDPDVIGNQDKFRALSKEYSQLEEVTKCFQAYQQAQDDLAAAEDMANEDDEEMREMAQEEIKEAKEAIERLTDELQILLLPKDPNDERNCFLEIQAGAGGDEAGIFAGDLFRMYSKYAEKAWLAYRSHVFKRSRTWRLQRDDRKSERRRCVRCAEVWVGRSPCTTCTGNRISRSCSYFRSVRSGYGWRSQKRICQKSKQQTWKSIRSVLQARVVSTLTPPILQSVLLTCQQVQW